MKKVLLGGFIFIGGAIMFSIGTLGIAHVEIQAQMMQFPQYLGILTMIAGFVFGVLGLKNEK